MLSALILAIFLQTEADQPPQKVPLLANADAPPIVLSLPRDERLRLTVIVAAPAVESEVEDLAIKAVNQHPDYWTNRTAPNLFVTVERVAEDGTRVRALTRIFSSGGGNSLEEHYCEIDVEMLDSREVRRQSVRQFLEKMAPTAGTEGAVDYLERLYISNPVGTYEISIEYKPATGIFAKQVLRRRLTVTVQDGPDSLDRMATDPQS